MRLLYSLEPVDTPGGGVTFCVVAICQINKHMSKITTDKIAPLTLIDTVFIH
jgi:hypothetical protein